MSNTCSSQSRGRVPIHFPVAPGAPLADFAAIAEGYPVFRIGARRPRAGARLAR